MPHGGVSHAACLAVSRHGAASPSVAARLLLLAAALAACDTPPSASDVTTADSAGVRIITVLAKPADLPEWTLASAPLAVITGAESGDSAALAPIGNALWLRTGDLFIADLGASRLLVYDSTGTFRRTLGRQGDGPGEFRSIGALSVAGGDTVATFDRSLRRLSYWHPEAGFVRTVSLADAGSLDAWPADAWAWRDSLIVVLQLAVSPPDSVPPGTGPRRWPMLAHLTVRDRTGRVLATSPTFPGMYTGRDDRGDVRLPFSVQPFTAVGRERVHFGSGQEFRIASLGADLRVDGDLRWPARNEPLTDAEVAATRAAIIAAATRRPSAERLRELDRTFARELRPANRPAIGRVFVDADERLWVERFEAARYGARAQTPVDQWTVLHADGRPLARVRLPDGTRLEAVRGDRVLVVQRDRFDVETVAVLALRGRVR